MIFEVKVGAKMLKMLYSKFLGRRTANSSSEGKRPRKNNGKSELQILRKLALKESISKSDTLSTSQTECTY